MSKDNKKFKNLDKGGSESSIQDNANASVDAGPNTKNTAKSKPNKNKKYDASDIVLLDGISAIRKRPSLYAGEFPFFRMFKEVIDNSMDEYNAYPFYKIGKAHIEVVVDANEQICSIRDFGRGIPVDMHASGSSALEVILTTLHSGGKFSDQTYQNSVGLHGVGLSLVNALSSFLEVKVYRNGKIYFMRFEKGQKTVDLEVIGTSRYNGTEITFKPDTSLAQDQLEWEAVEKYFKEITYLNQGLSIYSKWNEEEQLFASNKGLAGFLSDFKLVIPLIEFKGENVWVVFGWTSSISRYLCFTNKTHQEDGGTHFTGFKTAITRVIMSYISNLPKYTGIDSNDIHSNIVAVIACTVKDPRFASQTKNKLLSPEARSAVESLVFKQFGTYLEEHPSVAKEIIAHIFETTKERLAMEKTQSTFKATSKVARLPGKLIDCEYGPEKGNVLFLVEGDSAGGSASGSRDRKTQAILGMKGKVLNVERADIRKILKNEEISALISVLGTGIGQKCDMSKLRYSKVVILADADKDGDHITTLIITLFVVFMPQLIIQGKLYVGKPPLYKVQDGKYKEYIDTDGELDKFLFNRLFKKYMITDVNNNPLDIDTSIDLRNSCKNLHMKIRNSDAAIQEKIASMCSLINNIDDIEKYVLNVLDDVKQLKVERKDNILLVNLIDSVSSSKFEVNICRSINCKWPLRLVDNNGNVNIFYDPISFYQYIDKLCYSGNIYVQRFKGLGEMNAEELGDTVLSRDDLWIRVTGDEDIWSQICGNITHVMGNKSSRRDLVRNYYNNDVSF